jgi:alpha-amylase
MKQSDTADGYEVIRNRSENSMAPSILLQSSIGFVRQGTIDELGCLVVMSNGDASEIVAEVGQPHSGAIYLDFLGHREDEIVVGEDGRATSHVNGGSVSVWMRSDAI